MNYRQDVKQGVGQSVGVVLKWQNLLFIAAGDQSRPFRPIQAANI